jgi:uncharacterized Zn-finger protein
MVVSALMAVKSVGKKFTRFSDLTRHKNIHRGESPYVCSDCNKSFSEKCGLRKHALSQYGVRPYTCGKCGKTFREMSAAHMRVHSDVVSY